MSTGSVAMRVAGPVALLVGALAGGHAMAADRGDGQLFARYVAAVSSAVTHAWLRPDTAAPGLACVLVVEQIPGGEVVAVSFGSPCNADPATRTSIERAVIRAAPLPYRGYESVFERTIKFNFSYDG